MTNNMSPHARLIKELQDDNAQLKKENDALKERLADYEDKILLKLHAENFTDAAEEARELVSKAKIEYQEALRLKNIYRQAVRDLLKTI